MLHRAPVQQFKQTQVLSAIQDQLVQSVPTKRLHSHHVASTINVCLSRLELQDYFLSFVNKQKGTVAENGSSHQCRKKMCPNSSNNSSTGFGKNLFRKPHYITYRDFDNFSK